MRFEEVIPALREGKKIRRKNRNRIHYIQIGEENLIVDENDECFPFILEDFLADNWEIVKEKKKVKLRDMTESQYLKFRKKYCGSDICTTTCPFRYINCYYGIRWWKHKDLYSDKFLDQEIEIED